MAKLQPFQLADIDPQPAKIVVKNINDIKLTALSNIDTEAGKSRLQYITTAPGQSEIYTEKTEEALDYISAIGTIDDSSYPFIIAEANASNITCIEAAKLILSKKSQWINIAAKIEEVRRRGKIDIINCDTIDDIAKVEQDVISQLLLI
jgi:hypothetical protein